MIQSMFWVLVCRNRDLLARLLPTPQRLTSGSTVRSVLLDVGEVLRAAKLRWVWVKIKPPGDRKFWSLVPFTRFPFKVPIFDPQPDAFSV